MPEPQMHERAKLLPKRIVDVNGNTKTVWVKASQGMPTDEEKALGDIPPTLFNKVKDSLKPEPKYDPLEATRADKHTSDDRGYGTKSLSDHAARKFAQDFGVSIEDAPPVTFSNEQLYDYLARGISTERAMEYGRFGIEPHLAHPHLDAEYSFVAGYKVALADVRKQEKEDSYPRKKELADIRKVAHTLQDMGVPPLVANKCIQNGLRSEHFGSSNRSVEAIVEKSADNHVDSLAFRSFMEEKGTVGGAKRGAREMGTRMRKRATRSVYRTIRRSVNRSTRRMMNSFRRRTSRLFKKAFLPWRTS